jgi:beta-mannosidase
MRVVALAASSWRFRDLSGSKWLPATVPGCVHTDLLRAGKIPDPFWGTNEAGLQWIDEREWEYATDFDAGGDLLGEEVVELAADGLDTLATVSVNGRVVARTENMFIGFRWDIRPLLLPGRNELSVRFASATRYIRTHRTWHKPREINDPVGGCTAIRKEQCQFGWDWGPRFVTAGIWKDIRLEAWTGNRLVELEVSQDHLPDGSVTLSIAPRLARRDPRSTCAWRLGLGAKAIASGSGTAVRVANPSLWWPNGQGEQPLYSLEVDVLGKDGTLIGKWAQRIGLRTITLEQNKDRWGTSFHFAVNGRALFAKGANWIPANCFVAGLPRSAYTRDLEAAAAAHMNMIRVWGGGIYESEDFYDLCDELGLLVWQDFMFACTLYPGDPDFIESSREEAVHQVKRLRHRACLALWCGNNEVWGINAHELVDPKKKALRRDYERLFHRMLPSVVEAHGGATPYWPSSPWRGDPDTSHPAGEARGDTHFWDVWHGRNPVKDYEKWSFRFASEFGMQSYNSVQTQATFCPASDANIFGNVMEDHQKNRGGNQVILDYVSRRYRFPRNQQSLVYLSQLNQVHCVATGVGHYRRNMPRCMGALYWQLNDCWPVASWSSIEFTGRWRARHYAARRVVAPAYVSVHIPGDEVFGTNNYRTSTVRLAHVHTSYDGPREASGVVRWDLFHLDGTVVLSGRKRVSLHPMQSALQRTLDLRGPIEKFGREQLYLRVALDVGRKRVSEATAFLTLPRFMELPKPETRISVRVKAPRFAVLSFTSPVYQHKFEFDISGQTFTASDNFFDLYPGQSKVVEVDLMARVTPDMLRKSIRHRSLADTY